MSAQNGKPSARGPITPTSIASHLGLRWSTPGHGSGLMTWDVLLDLVVVAYWLRRPPGDKPANACQPAAVERTNE